MARHTAKSHKIRKVEILVIQIRIYAYFYYTIYAQKKRQKFLRISKIVYNFKADWKMET